MELMRSGDLFAGTSHPAPVKLDQARAKLVAGLRPAAPVKVADVRLAGPDRERDLFLGHAKRHQVGNDGLEAHALHNTAYAFIRKCVRRGRYSLGGTVTTSDENMSVGQRLKDARKARKLSQDRLAKISGVSQSTISDVERGRNTSSKELPVLAAALGVSALWLSTGRGPRHDGAPIRPTAPQRQINTDLMVQAMRAVTAYQQQIGSKLDDDDLLRLACRVYEQHIDSPDRTAAEMLGYLMSISSALSKSTGRP